jgi:ethanolamine utilization microcompartment shell protein EutS
MNDPINLIQIIGFENETLNFGNFLSKNNSIIIKNCYNVKIIIQSKINKITIEKSNKLLINVHKLITGIEIAHSKSILISSDIDDESSTCSKIPFMDMFKSTIYLVGSIKLYSNIKVISDQSELFHLDTAEM